MNRDDVDKIDFWKWRLDEAQKAGFLHWSVYLANDKRWAEINTAHEEVFKKEIPPSNKVLDAGCGYGRWAIRFDNYTGVDFSPDFISKAKELNPDKNFVLADLRQLPFKDKEFDVAFCISIKNMIQKNIGDEMWNDMEKELIRVAKKLLILEYPEPDQYEICE